MSSYDFSGVEVSHLAQALRETAGRPSNICLTIYARMTGRGGILYQQSDIPAATWAQRLFILSVADLNLDLFQFLLAIDRVRLASRLKDFPMNQDQERYNGSLLGLLAIMLNNDPANNEEDRVQSRNMVAQLRRIASENNLLQQRFAIESGDSCLEDILHELELGLSSQENPPPVPEPECTAACVTSSAD